MLKSSEALTLQEQHITTPLAFSVAGPKIWNSLPSIGFALLRLLRHFNQDRKCTCSVLLNIHHDQDSLDLTTGNTTLEKQSLTESVTDATCITQMAL